nr:hypothetical protein [Paraburkholderia sabiae]
MARRSYRRCNDARVLSDGCVDRRYRVCARAARDGSQAAARFGSVCRDARGSDEPDPRRRTR